MSERYAIRSIPVDALGWYPVAAPIYCNQFSIRPDLDILMRTDSGDSGTQDTLEENATEYSAFDWPFQNPYQGARFKLGDIIVYVQAVSGYGTVVAKFLL